MSNMYNTIISLCGEKGVSGYRLCKDVGLQPSLLTDLKMGRQKSLSAANAEKVANYFGVSVGYLLGKEQKNTPTSDGGERNYQDEVLVEAFARADESTREAILLLLKLK